MATTSTRQPGGGGNAGSPPNPSLPLFRLFRPQVLLPQDLRKAAPLLAIPTPTSVTFPLATSNAKTMPCLLTVLLTSSAPSAAVPSRTDAFQTSSGRRRETPGKELFPFSHLSCNRTVNLTSGTQTGQKGWWEGARSTVSPTGTVICPRTLQFGKAVEGSGQSSTQERGSHR